MKKIGIIVCISLLLYGCGTTQKVTETPDTKTTVSTKETSQETITQQTTVKQGESVKITPKKPAAKKMLVGKESREALTVAPFNTWFEKNYSSYSVKDSLSPAIKKGLKGVTITTFMGTWCGDSKRETPRMLKILDAAKYKEKNFELITVDRTKKNPKEFTDGNNIIRVPTFIFKKDGEEIGRIVERPVESLEEDMLKILNGEPYKHAYEK